MSGATFQFIIEHDSFTTPDGNSFSSIDAYWHTRELQVQITDTVVYDLDTQQFTVYLNTNPNTLITGHEDFAGINIDRHIAVYSKVTRLFHVVSIGIDEINAPEAMTFVGDFLYGKFIDAGSNYDNDSDGLINKEEIEAGTDLNKSDTDGDGLLDGHEVLSYGTSPLLKDTDGDGFDDDVEINQYGSDPLVATDTPANGDVTEDGLINAGDLIVCKRIAFGDIVSPTEQQRVRCDMAPVNSFTGIPQPDGFINAADLWRLTQSLLQI